MGYSYKIVRGQNAAQQDLLKKETLYPSNSGIYISDWLHQLLDSISQLTMLGYNIEENECAELLL